MTNHSPTLKDCIALIRSVSTEQLTAALMELQRELERRPDADLIISGWSIEDVHGRRPDLSEMECREVLRTVERRHDANIGINWDVIDMIADDLYPEPDNLDELREAAEE